MDCLSLGGILATIEHAIEQELIKFDQVELKTLNYWMFKSNDNLKFAPVINTIENMIHCYRAAYQFGYLWFERNNNGIFNISQQTSNQTLYPYILLTLTDETL